MGKWRGASIAATAAVLLATAACAGAEDGGKDDKGKAPATAAAPAGAQPAVAGQARAAGQLTVWNSKDLGPVLTDSAGFTLYRFDKDTAEPPKSNCDGDCAKAWPIVPADGAGAATGIDAGLLGSVTRSDGTKQLTVAGWPMYRFAKDTAPRQAKGQGVGGVWFAAAPDGKKAAKGDAASRPSGTGAGADAGAGAGDLPGLSTRKDPKLGEIVVDQNGMTVYRFVKDSAWPMKTACTGDCLKKWPVVAPVDKNDTQGILKKGFVTFSRPDGIKQQTIDCWPLYTFYGDTKPGDTKGQGVGGTWYAVSPEGKLVK
ncbi:SCO0930 family lipoprotein [Streptomyces sp. NPDC054940]